MSNWKHLLAALTIAGASGAAIASDTTAHDANHEAGYASSAGETSAGQTASDRPQGQDAKSTPSEGEAS